MPCSRACGCRKPVMAFDLQRPLDGTAPPRSISKAHHRTALGSAASQPETSGHQGDPHVIQTLQVRAHDTVWHPTRLAGQELPPGRRRPPRRGSEAGGGQDPADRPLPHPVPQADHLTLDAPVPPAWILPCQLLHQCPYFGRGRRAPRRVRIGPLSLEQPPVPS